MKRIVNKTTIFFLILAFLGSCSQVETTKPERKDIIDAVFASGEVVFENEYQVTANTEGYLIKSFVEEGSEVQSDIPLFQLANEVQSENLSSAEVNYRDAVSKLNTNSPEITQLKIQLDQAERQLWKDRKNYERYEKLVEKEAVSQAEFESIKYQYESSVNNVKLKEKSLADRINTLEVNLQNAKSQLAIQQSANNDYFLTSAIDGKVLKLYKQPGELIRRGEVIALIGGGRELARLLVSEEDIEEIAVGQLVYINLNTNKDTNVEGKVSKIYPSFDESVQSFIVEAYFEKLPEKVYHNTQLQANIIIDRIADALVIPSGYLSEGDSLLAGSRKVAVKLGIRNEQWVQVISGVDENTTLQKPDEL